MPEIIVIIVAVIVLLNLLCIKAYFKLRNYTVSKFNQLKISLIIPFKNEEKVLPHLLESILSVDYATENFEIILVDDNSTDNSIKLIEEFSVKNLRIIKAENKTIPGKKGALEIGIKQANFDIIAITDADCIIGKNWLKSISHKISEGYDLVFGYSPFIKGQKIISKVSAYENLRNFILYFFSVELGFPYGATARSIAFKKSVYIEVNGYRNTTETLSGDDDLFIRECIKKNFKVGYFLDKDSYVQTYPSENFIEYIFRKSRHLKTSHHYLLKQKIILTVWYSINFIANLSIFFIPLTFYFVIPFAVKIILDLILLKLIKSKIEHDFNFNEIIYLEFIYQLLVAVNFIASLVLKDNWKKS